MPPFPDPDPDRDTVLLIFAEGADFKPPAPDSLFLEAGSSIFTFFASGFALACILGSGGADSFSPSTDSYDE